MAKTRLGVGGPSKNYTRPVAAKTETEIKPKADTKFINDVGTMMNP